MAAPSLPPPPLATQLVQGDGSPTPTWAKWLQLLGAVLGGAVVPNGWRAATLLNSFVNLAGYTAQYRKDASGVVWLEGSVNGGSGTDVILTLPVGFRPAQQKNFATAISAGGTEGHGRLKVDASGNVSIASGAGSTFNSLDCAFLADG